MRNAPQSVSFRGAKHFGVWLRQSSTITRLEAPHVFIDESREGPLRSMRHVHEFVPDRGATVMRDQFDYALPAGILGRAADRLIVERHMRRFLTERALYLRTEAERSGGGG